MKSSATSAVKQTLKPDAYKQSEPSLPGSPAGRKTGWGLRGGVTAYLLHNGSASYRVQQA